MRAVVLQLAIFATVLGSAAAARGDEAADVARVEALIKANKLDEAIAKAEVALPTATTPRVGTLLAEACQKKAAAMAEKDKPAAELLAMVDRGLRGMRTVKLLKFRARILKAVERLPEAYEAYEEALDRGPDGKDAADIAGEMATLYKALADRMCRVTVTSSAPDAKVKVGAATEGKALPARLWLPRGGHVLVIATATGSRPRNVDCGDTPISLHADPEGTPPGRAIAPTPPPASPLEAKSAPVAVASEPKPRFVAPRIEGPRPRSTVHAYGPWASLALGAVGLGLGIAWNVDYEIKYAKNLKLDPDQKLASITGYVAGGTLAAAGLAWLVLRPAEAN